MNYRMLDKDTITVGGATLKRIVATAHITLGIPGVGAVEPGDLGGYIQSENNLAQGGLCWVGANAKVYGKARVSENAVVLGTSEVSGRARVSGNAKVMTGSIINGCAHVYGNAEVVQCKIGGISSIGSGRHVGTVADDLCLEAPRKTKSA